jgi:hypothetical protein
MTRAVHKNGLDQDISGFVVNVSPAVIQQGEICDVLDLILGPLDLNLLGLMVHLDRLRLTITAKRGGGLLGDLFCSLAGGPPPPGAAPQARKRLISEGAPRSGGALSLSGNAC